MIGLGFLVAGLILGFCLCWVMPRTPAAVPPVPPGSRDSLMAVADTVTGPAPLGDTELRFLAALTADLGGVPAAAAAFADHLRTVLPRVADAELARVILETVDLAAGSLTGDGPGAWKDACTQLIGTLSAAAVELSAAHRAVPL